MQAGSSLIGDNEAAWDSRAKRRGRHAHQAREEDFPRALAILDPEGWLPPSVAGWNALCLAGGGGLQSAFLSAAGAKVTVVDISDEMLELDRKMARRHGWEVEVMRSDMRDLGALPNSRFDLVLQPVSTCYIADLAGLYSEVGRVLKDGALYISQHKQPVSLQTSALPRTGGYTLVEPCVEGHALGPVEFDLEHRESGMAEYIHTWSGLIGAMCRAGFVLEDLAEPGPGLRSVGCLDRARFARPYVKLKARCKKKAESGLIASA